MLEKDNTEFEAAFRELSSDKAESEQTPPAAEENDDGNAAEADKQGADLPPSDDPQETNQTDIWSNATDEQRAAYEAAEEGRRNLEHRVRSEDGRVARYQSDRDKAQRKLEILVSAAGKDEEDLRALVASDEWQRTKTDYGDDLGPVFNALERLTNQQAGVSERFQQIDAETAEVAEADNFEMLTEKAPDWRDLLGREDFSSWLGSQPKPWQQVFQENSERLIDPSSALELVSRYRVHVALSENGSSKAPKVQLDPRRARQLDGARSTTSRTPVVADSGGGDFDAEFNRAVQQRERKTR